MDLNFHFGSVGELGFLYSVRGFFSLVGEFLPRSLFRSLAFFCLSVLSFSSFPFSLLFFFVVLFFVSLFLARLSRWNPDQSQYPDYLD